MGNDFDITRFLNEDNIEFIEKLLKEIYKTIGGQVTSSNESLPLSLNKLTKSCALQIQNFNASGKLCVVCYLLCP